MGNKSKAVREMLGDSLSSGKARKFFIEVYTFIMYNDTESFLEVLAYRTDMQARNSTREDYHLFRFMLQQMLQKHPSRLMALRPLR